MGLAIQAVLVLALGIGPLGPPDHIGFAVRYDPGVMEGRAAAHDAPPADCYVAYTLARDQDMARLWLRVAGPAGALDCLVVDLPDDGQGHREPLIARKVWIELGWVNRWICGKGWSGRAKDCPIRVWVLGEQVRGVIWSHGSARDAGLFTPDGLRSVRASHRPPPAHPRLARSRPIAADLRCWYATAI